MTRFSFEWKSGHFSTDCRDIAAMFVRAPENFQPMMREKISGAVRAAFERVLNLHAKRAPARGVRTMEAVDGISIALEEMVIRMP